MFDVQLTSNQSHVMFFYFILICMFDLCLDVSFNVNLMYFQYQLTPGLYQCLCSIFFILDYFLYIYILFVCSIVLAKNSLLCWH